MPQLTMNEISYGINSPKDLFDKLVLEGEKINANPHPYDLFNFFVTAAVLNEWVKRSYSQHSVVQNIIESLKTKIPENLPTNTASWIVDKSCLPNGCEELRHVYNIMKICWDTANASKHYYWAESGVSAIEDAPVIIDFYQYFFTSTEPGIYIEYADQYYTVLQIKRILNQFYLGLFSHLENE